jgi:hypothetical protein
VIPKLPLCGCSELAAQVEPGSLVQALEMSPVSKSSEKKVFCAEVLRMFTPGAPRSTEVAP